MQSSFFHGGTTTSSTAPHFGITDTGSSSRPGARQRVDEIMCMSGMLECRCMMSAWRVAVRDTSDHLEEDRDAGSPTTEEKCRCMRWCRHLCTRQLKPTVASASDDHQVVRRVRAPVVRGVLGDTPLGSRRCTESGRSWGRAPSVPSTRSARPLAAPLGGGASMRKGCLGVEKWSAPQVPATASHRVRAKSFRHRVVG